LVGEALGPLRGRGPRRRDPRRLAGNAGSPARRCCPHRRRRPRPSRARARRRPARSGFEAARSGEDAPPDGGGSGASRRPERERGGHASGRARACGRDREALRWSLRPAARSGAAMKRLGQALVALALGAFGLVARALPYGAALACGRAAGRAALASGIRRAVVLENLARAYPEWNEGQVRDTTRRTYEIWGQVLVDLLRAPDLG